MFFPIIQIKNNSKRAKLSFAPPMFIYTKDFAQITIYIQNSSALIVNKETWIVLDLREAMNKNCQYSYKNL
jgi:hypothetical protein